MNKVDLHVDLNGLQLDNPVLTASGTYGFGLEYGQIIDVTSLGGIVSKGLTLEPCSGNAGIRIQETPSGLLNCIGLENPGVKAFIKDYLPLMKKLKTKIIVNISGYTIEQYGEIASILDKAPGIAGLEINISCPNVQAGGMAFGTDAKLVEKVTKVVRENTHLPIITKLSPNVTDIADMAEAAERGGANAISLINTLLGMAIDINKRKPILGNIMGGLSGPAVKPVALRMVWQAYQRVNIPIIGLGGISTWQDALEFIMAGASAITVGTANFINPLAPLQILEGIRNYCQKGGVNSFNELVGIAQRGDIYEK